MGKDAVIAVVGGTGNLGSAIARRLAKAGCRGIIGSRSAESAAAAATELGFGLSGLANPKAAAAADIIIVTALFAAQEATLKAIAPHVTGKIVVDCGVLVFGGEKAARVEVVELVAAMGLRGLHGGALANAAAAEVLTSVLIFINKTYQVDGAGIAITGELIMSEI